MDVPTRTAAVDPCKSLIFLKVGSAQHRRDAGQPEFGRPCRPGSRIGFSEQTLGARVRDRGAAIRTTWLARAARFARSNRNAKGRANKASKARNEQPARGFRLGRADGHPSAAL